MFKRLTVLWTVVRGDARQLWFALRHPAAPAWLKWGTAAIVLPIVAGRLFDLTQGYGTAVLIAAAGNIIGIFVALGLPRQRARRTAH